MRISVVIPAYKAEAYIAQTIESVLRQTLKPIEIIVVDDGSPDRSGDVAASYPEVRVIRQENAGVANARNAGLAASSGDGLAFLDADDVWEPQFLEKSVEALIRHKADVSYTSRRNLVQQPDQSFVYAPRVHSYVLAVRLSSVLPERCPFPPSCVVIKRQALESVGGFDQRFSPSEDWEMWLRLLKSGARFAFEPLPLMWYRVHRASASFNASKMYDAGVRVATEHSLRPRRTISRLMGEKAIMLQENSQAGALRLMMRSICKHPFHDFHRHKVLAHMLLIGTDLEPTTKRSRLTLRVRARRLERG